jgi:hypothetical protein
LEHQEFMETASRRCTQVHECLGRLREFRESYQRNRRLQLNSDLAPPASFLDGYQDFIAQLTGFFVIEDRVQRRCADLCAGAQVGLFGHPHILNQCPPSFHTLICLDLDASHPCISSCTATRTTQ